jgi:hypothetical protein
MCAVSARISQEFIGKFNSELAAITAKEHTFECLINAAGLALCCILRAIIDFFFSLWVT